MEQPPGFQQSNGNFPLVCKLCKDIYGLKQAPRAWFERLHNFQSSVGFISSRADNSLFLRFAKQPTLFILVYVDDIFITGSSINEIQSLVTQLNTALSLKDLGNLSSFLGIEKFFKILMGFISHKQNIF